MRGTLQEGPLAEVVDTPTPAAVTKGLTLAAAASTPREQRALRSCSKGLYTALSALVASASAPDDELLVPAGIEPLCVRLLAKCPNCSRLRVTPAQLSSCTMQQLRSMTSLTLVSDYALYEQSFGRAQVLLNMRSLIGLQQLQHLVIQQCLAREGWESLLHLRNLTSLDLSGMLEVNNKLLSMLPRITTLKDLCLPAASCHAPRMNQLTAQGLHICLPLMRRLTTLHIKSVDLEPLGIEAVKSWNPCPVAHPSLFKSLASNTLPGLVSLSLEGLSETLIVDTASSLTASGRQSVNGVATAGPSFSNVRAALGSRASSFVSSSTSPPLTPKSSFGDVPAQGPMYQALQLLAGLPQLKYLCLGIHVQVDYTPVAQRLGTTELESRPSDKSQTHPKPLRACIRLCVDDALVTCLTSALTHLTGLVFRDCWHIAAPGLGQIATALPGLQLLNLEGSCRVLEVEQLSVLSTLSQLRTLGLARWGHTAWCPPYTYKSRLEEREQEQIHGMMGSVSSMYQNVRPAAATPGGKPPPCQALQQQQQLAGSVQPSEVAATLWHSACTSPSPERFPQQAQQLQPRGGGGEDGWFLTKFRRRHGHATSRTIPVVVPAINTRSNEITPDMYGADDGQQSGSLSYQDIDMDDFMINAISSGQGSSLDQRSQEFMLSARLSARSSMAQDRSSQPYTHVTFQSRFSADAGSHAAPEQQHVHAGSSGTGQMPSVFTSPHARRAGAAGPHVVVWSPSNESKDSLTSISTEGRGAVANRGEGRGGDEGFLMEGGAGAKKEWEGDILLHTSPYTSPAKAPWLCTPQTIIKENTVWPEPAPEPGSLAAQQDLSFERPRKQLELHSSDSSLEELVLQLRQTALPDGTSHGGTSRRKLSIANVCPTSQPVKPVKPSHPVEAATCSLLMNPSPVESATDATIAVPSGPNSGTDAAADWSVSEIADDNNAELCSAADDLNVFSNVEFSPPGAPTILGMLGRQHPALTHLDLSAWPGLSGRELQQLAHSPAGQNLLGLRLASCYGLSAADLFYLAGMALLQKLDLSYTRIVQEQVVVLPYIPHINELVLSHCIMDWAASKALRDLSVKHCFKVCGYVDANTSQASIASAMKRCRSNALLPLKDSVDGNMTGSDDVAGRHRSLSDFNAAKGQSALSMRPITTPGVVSSHQQALRHKLAG